MIAQVDRGYMRYGMGRLVRRLVSYAFFEGRPLTTRGRWFNPVIFLWLRMLSSLPGTCKVSQPIFITGLGRTGTTILGVLLSLHRNIGFLNEPKAIWHVVDPRHDVNGNYSSRGGVFRLAEADVTDKTRCTTHRLFSRYLRVVGATRLVDKYPELIFRVGYVKQVFPDAKVIFITRSGVDAVVSIVKWSQRLRTQGKEWVDDWWGRNDLKWAYLREQLLAHDPEYKSVRDLAGADLDHVNRSALEWIVTMREGLRCEEKYRDFIIRVSYEELLQNPEDTLVRIQRRCNLEIDQDVLSYAKKTIHGNAAHSWPVLLPQIDMLFTETMNRLGYPCNRP